MAWEQSLGPMARLQRAKGGPLALEKGEAALYAGQRAGPQRGTVPQRVTVHSSGIKQIGVGIYVGVSRM